MNNGLAEGTLSSRQVNRDCTGFAFVVVATVVFTLNNEANVVFVEGVIHRPHMAFFQNYVLLAARETGKVRSVTLKVGEFQCPGPADEYKA